MLPDEWIPYFLRNYCGVKPDSLLEAIIIGMMFPIVCGLGIWIFARDYI